MKLITVVRLAPVLLVLRAVPISAASSQNMTGEPTVDSAAVARMAWSRAAAALRNGQVEAAHRETTRAAGAWPQQPAYVWGRAITAALLNDTSAARASLQQYAAFGLGRDLRRDTTF